MHTIGYYLAIKHNEILPFGTSCMYFIMKRERPVYLSERGCRNNNGSNVVSSLCKRSYIWVGPTLFGMEDAKAQTMRVIM